MKNNETENQNCGEFSYKTFMEHSPLAIFLTNLKGEYLWANPAACELTGYTLEELKTKTVLDLSPPEMGEKVRAGNSEVNQRGVISDDFIGLKKNGDRYFGRTHISKTIEDQIIAYVEDISERVEIEKKLQEYTEILEKKNQELDDALKLAREANEAKSLYLAHMNHEIRTPLNGLMGFLQMMEETRLNEEQEEFVSYMKKASSHMLSIIGNVLDMAKIESGEIQLMEEEFLPVREIHTALAPLYSLAHGKNVKLELSLDEKLPQKAVGDAGRFRQIILNIAGNAVKFTKKGAVYIGVNLWKEQKDSYELQLKCKDTGPGMNQSTMERVFQPFYQDLSGSKVPTGGTGLGLPITKELVDLMKGKIEVKSIPGKGTSFIVYLILKKAEEHH